MDVTTAVFRSWPWARALAWGLGTVVVLGIAGIGSEIRLSTQVVTALSNGVLVFSIVGGIGAMERLRDAPSPNPWVVAAVPAALTFGVVLALRWGALAAGVDGPWHSWAETALDVAFRSTATYLAVAVFGLATRPAAS